MKNNFYSEPDVPGFDCEDGLKGLDGKFKKFYQPDMCYPMKNDAIFKKKMHGEPSRSLFDEIIHESINL